MTTALASRAARPSSADTAGHRISHLAHDITVYLAGHLARHDVDRLAEVTGLEARRLHTVADVGDGALHVDDYEILCRALGLDPIEAAEAARRH